MPRASLVRTLIALTLLALVAEGLAHADATKLVTVEVNGLTHLRLDKPISRISVGATEIADVAAFPPNELLVTGKRVGQTATTVWFRDDSVTTLRIVVGFPIEAIEAALAEQLPRNAKVRVQNAGNSIILSGVVPDAADAEEAEAIAAAFIGTTNPNMQSAAPVVNLLTVGGDQQVQLEVAFAEVSRSALKQMGINVWAKSIDNGFDGGLINPSLTGTTGTPDGPLPLLAAPLGSTFGVLFSTGLDNAFPFSAALSVLANRGYARTLAEPTLVALSGEEATFLAGGEFPIPLPQALGQVVIEFKKFGVQLNFVPTVVRDTIQLKMSLTVSDLDFSLGVKLSSVTVPGLTERHSTTTIRLRDGQSFAIAGLLSDKVRSSVDKVPWLGDVPLLGALFRSTSYRREETELLVVVTARLVRPNDDRPALPGEDTRTDPSDLELFLLGNNESKPGGAVPRPAAAPAPRDEPSEPAGPVGFKRGRGRNQ